MTRYQLPIAGSMAVVVYLAMGLAALREQSEMWATVTYSTAVALLLASGPGAAFGRGRVRAAWLGFALVGWPYFVICLSGYFYTYNGFLVTSVALELIRPDPQNQPPRNFLAIGHSIWMILVGGLGAAIAAALAGRGAATEG